MLVAMTTTLLALDGNSVLHRSFHSHARTGYQTPDGRAGWAVRGLLEQLVAAVDRACADVVVVGFDDPEASVRRERWPAYKAQRPEKPGTLVSQLADAVATLRDMGVPVIVPRGLEADDVLAAAARAGRTAGWDTVLATSDRDAFALIDDSTRVLRLIKGGVDASPMLTPHRLELMTGVTPAQYADLAALRGDPSDNLPGIKGIGKIIAARLLQTFGSAQALFDDLDGGGDGCRVCVGPAATRRLLESGARELWQFNRTVMTPDPAAQIDADALSAALPLASLPVRREFRRYALSHRQALTVLCGETPAVPDPWDSDADWRPPATVVRRFPPLPSKASSLQETLF